MENILDFLSKNYIWFFVGAVILIFALIGFIVQGKKNNKKKEFKGESIPNEEAVANSGSMEINDIPVEQSPLETEPTQEQSSEKIEFYSEAPTMPPIEEAKPEPITEPVHDLNNFETVPTFEPEPISEPTVETPITSEPIVSSEQTPNEPIYDTPIINEQTQNPSTFELNNENNTDTIERQ